MFVLDTATYEEADKSSFNCGLESPTNLLSSGNKFPIVIQVYLWYYSLCISICSVFYVLECLCFAVFFAMYILF